MRFLAFSTINKCFLYAPAVRQEVIPGPSFTIRCLVGFLRVLLLPTNLTLAIELKRNNWHSRFATGLLREEL